MDQYMNFGVEDFVWDEFFRQWVLAPTRENDNQWKQWIAENPDHAETVEKARQVVKGLKVREELISDDEIRHVVNRTVNRIEEPAEEYSDWSNGSRFYQRWWFHAAASAVLLITVGLTLRFYKSIPENIAVKPVQEIKIVADSVRLIERTNNSDRPMEIVLDDNSRVTLMESSTIRYSERFSESRREVYLEGEAFFDIAKDPDRPFFVYANELVTKVLGTSFKVSAYPSARQVTVEVKTGRVSVFAKSDPQIKDRMSRRELEGVILNPNQKIIFERVAVRMVKTLVERPEIVLPKSKIPHFEFEDTPASEAFASIGKAYGIDILFDEELLSGCPLTAALDNQPLHEKLTIICKAVEAEYEILDGQIIIHSRGCRN
jgi:transmembrane sensor